MQRIFPAPDSFKKAGDVMSQAVYPRASKVERMPPEGKEEASGSLCKRSLPENVITVFPSSSEGRRNESCFSAVVPFNGWNQCV